MDALAAESTARLVVQVTNSRPSVERVRLALDGVDALDVDQSQRAWGDITVYGSRPIWG